MECCKQGERWLKIGLERCVGGIHGRRPFRQGEEKRFHSKWNGKPIEVFKHGKDIILILKITLIDE